MGVYLDNAATTSVHEKVLEAMLPYLSGTFGNPSSTHAYGREAKTAVESARKKLGRLLNCHAGHLFFTGSGTEADNAAIFGAIRDHGIKHLITSPIEHHAVLHAVEYSAKQGWAQAHVLDVNPKGEVDVNQLKKLLESHPNAMVSLMHANNEIGNLNPIAEIRELCTTNGALFHSDTVQSIGHYVLDASDPACPDYFVASAHKFHGPKGVGFLYMHPDRKLKTVIHGGGQERGFRGGTENVAGIVGMAKALELAYETLKKDRQHIQGLKERLVTGLKHTIANVSFNGLSESSDSALYNLVSISLPSAGANQLVLFQLDLKGIALSGGSACSSGALYGSHVLEALQVDQDRGVLRVSFSKFNTTEEVDLLLEVLKELYA